MPRLRYGTRRVVVEIIVVSTIVGAAVGGLWILLAPDVVGVVDPEADEGFRVGLIAAGGQFPREAVLGSLAGGAGLITAAYYAMRFRMRPVSTLLALLAGGAAGTAVAVLVGRLAGPGDAAVRAAQAAAGDELVLPLRIDAYGVLAAWPLVAALVVFAVALARDNRSPWGPTVSDQPRPMGATTADVS